MENLTILSDLESGDVYVAYTYPENGEVIAATRSLHYAEVQAVVDFHSHGGDVMNVTEGAPEYMSCADAGYLNSRHLRRALLSEFDGE